MVFMQILIFNLSNFGVIVVNLILLYKKNSDGIVNFHEKMRYDWPDSI